MDQDPIKPQDPQGETSKPLAVPIPPATPTPVGPTVPSPISVPVPQKPNVGGADIGAILLPKKPVAGATLDSAMRVNAGILFDQEQHAELPKTAPAQKTPEPPQPPKEETVVKALETYQSDIESVVHGKNMSAISIAAAEANRRSGMTTPAPKEKFTLSPALIKTLLILGGVVMLLAAIAVVIYALQPAPTVQVLSEAPAPFISVDQTKAFSIPPALQEHAAALSALDVQRKNITLSLGLIARLYLALPSATSSAVVPLSAQQLLAILSPSAPDTLVRTLNRNNYLLGVHAYDSNQPLLILQTDSYEQAYSGMLAWEPYMKKDLAPLFSRTPRAHIPEEGIASSSASSTTTFIQSGFVDRIVENHDARVIQNSTGDILLLWTFLDRKTLVVTTNEATLREIISRFKNAPVTPLP